MGELDAAHDKRAALEWAESLDWADADQLSIGDAATFTLACREQLLDAVVRGQLVPCAHRRGVPLFSQSSLFEFLRDDARSFATIRDAVTSASLVDDDRVTPARVTRDQPPRDQPMHLYLVEIVGVCVKVGITSAPKSRISTHVSTAQKHGCEVGRVWVSMLHDEARDNEATIKGDSPTEYLAGRSYDDVIGQALELTYTPAAPSHG